MKQQMKWLLGFAAAVSLVACQNTESTLTTSYGSGAINGNVVIADSAISSFPAGIEVRAIGTGLSAQTDSAGNFAIFGLPDRDVTLSFERASDGISARLEGVTAGALKVAVTKNKATKRGRGIGHPGVEIEGVVKSFGSGSLVVTAEHLGDVTVAVTTDTIIRKGNQTLTTDALVAGARVHVKAKFLEDGSKVAVEIMVQNNGSGGDDSSDDDANTMTANGRVSAIGASELTVHTADGRDVTVRVDANTQIKWRGNAYDFAKIVVGDHVETLGTKVDDHTELAKKIQVEPQEK